MGNKTKIDWIKNYIKEKTEMIVLLLILALFTTVILYLGNVPGEIILYILELWLVFILIFGTISFYKYKKKNDFLDFLYKTEDVRNYSKSDAMTYNMGPTEQKYIDLLKRKEEEKDEMIQKAIMQKTEMMDYYAIWAHQIKTPIAAMNVLLQVMEDEQEKNNIRALREELFKIDFYTEAVMQYLRLEDTSSDFCFEKSSLKPIIHKAVRRFSSSFIHKKIALHIECDENIQIVTDSKWLLFIVEQILSNAVKYTPAGGEVSITVIQNINKHNQLKQTTIYIKDTGIGIRQEDLPRIMERGFTGYNGRMNQKSSGIGLYLCKKAADKLGIQISFESEVGKGTAVCLEMSEQKIWE